MRKDFTDSPIMIVGCARSGTSMVAGTIHTCGAWKGNTVGSSKWNAKGMFENGSLRNKFLKTILHAMGVDKMGQFPLPETKDVFIPHDFREGVLSEIERQGWTPDKPWMWKCAKMALIWPVWNYAFPNSKWVIVRRKTPDIIHSCMHTGFMNAYANKEVQKKAGVDNEYDGWLQWVHKHEEKFVEIHQSEINAKEIWPQRMVDGNYQQMKELIEWLGLEWKGQKVMEFIEPKLWKARNANKKKR